MSRNSAQWLTILTASLPCQCWNRGYFRYLTRCKQIPNGVEQVRTDRQTYTDIYRQTNRRTETHTHTYRYRQTDIHRHIQTDKQTDGDTYTHIQIQTDRHTQTYTDRQTDGRRHIHTHRQIQIDKHIIK